MVQKIKKGDKVKIICGKDKGKEEKVATVFPAIAKVLVEKVNVVKRHAKPSQNHRGGIIEKSAPIAISKVMLVCPSCSKAVRVGFKSGKNKEKVRYCKKCGENID